MAIKELNPDQEHDQLADALRDLPPVVLSALHATLDKREAVCAEALRRAQKLYEVLYKIAHQSGRRNAAHIIQIAREGLEELEP